MKNLPIQTPQRAITDLREVFFPEEPSRFDEFEVSIRVSDEGLELRDLSAFLLFIDRIYGRVSEDGLRSYARRETGHLQISEVRRGSLELILLQAITSPQATALIIVFLALKYLPPGVQSIASAYNEYEQGRLAKESRKRIRVEMESDQKLARLSPTRRRQVAELIEYLHSQEREELPRAIRFARHHLLSLSLRIRGSNDGGS